MITVQVKNRTSNALQFIGKYWSFAAFGSAMCSLLSDYPTAEYDYVVTRE